MMESENIFPKKKKKRPNKEHGVHFQLNVNLNSDCKKYNILDTFLNSSPRKKKKNSPKKQKKQDNLRPFQQKLFSQERSFVNKSL